MNMKTLAPIVIAVVFATSCVPGLLNKYRRGASDQPQLSAETLPANAASEPTTTRSGAFGQTAKPQPQSIVAINDRTFRFNISESDVWDGALNVLLQNYALTIIDRDSGVITTEWDSYFNDRTVYRNKVSMRIRKQGFRSAEVTIHNNLERLQDAAQAGSVGAIWLPSKDDSREIGRIVRNMAIALGQQVPQLPGNLAASDVLNDAPEAPVQ